MLIHGKEASAPLKLGVPERRLPRELRLVEEHAAPVAEVLVPGDLPVALLRARKITYYHVCSCLQESE